MTHKILDPTHTSVLKSIARFVVEVTAALSAGLLLTFFIIVMTVAIFPSARDGLVRQIVQLSAQGEQP